MDIKSAKNLQTHIEKYMKKHEHNTLSISKKGKNPFPVSARTIASIKKTAEENDGKGYQAAKIEKLCKFLNAKYVRKGSSVQVLKGAACANRCDGCKCSKDV